MIKKTQKGIVHLGVVLLLLVLAVVAFAGYKVSQNRTDNSAASINRPVTAREIPTVKNTADLNTIEITLSNQNIDGNLNPDSLNNDVDSLL